MTDLDLIVYIGPGEKIPGSKFGPALQQHQSYLCVDCISGNSAHPVGQWGSELYMNLSDKVKSQVEYVDADARENIPLEEGSASEVRIYNVLGDPTIGGRMAFLQQAKRVLRPGGFISVAETLTPHVFSIQDLLNLVAKAGLESRVVFNGDLTDDHKAILVEKLGNPILMYGSPYMVEAYKNS